MKFPITNDRSWVRCIDHSQPWVGLYSATVTFYCGGRQLNEWVSWFVALAARVKNNCSCMSSMTTQHSPNLCVYVKAHLAPYRLNAQNPFHFIWTKTINIIVALAWFVRQSVAGSTFHMSPVRSLHVAHFTCHPFAVYESVCLCQICMCDF